MNLDQTFTEAYLADQLSHILSSTGYEVIEGKKQLRKGRFSGFQNVIYAVSAYADSVWVEFHLGIRVDAIEQMAGRFTRTLPGWRADAHTVVVSEGKLQGQPYMRRTAKTVQDLDRIVDEFHHFWEDKGAQFLDTHTSIRGADILLNAQPQKKSIYLPNQAHRYIKGITAAKLAHNARFTDLAKTYLLAFDTLPNGHLWVEEYRKLVAYLSNLSLN
ncbi:MAG: hypothetical protein AAFW00_05380 [Bacteroidota bacterium]